MIPNRGARLGLQFHPKVGRAFHSEISGCNILLSVSIGGAMSEACWAGEIDSFLIVDGSVDDWELKDGWIVSSNAASTGVEHRSSWQSLVVLEV